MTLPNILFIELNGLVLNNLSASPKSKKKWQSIYVKTAKAALEIISNEPIVVAVANFGNDLGNYQFFFQNLISLSRQPQILVLLEVIDEKSADTIESVHQCISVHSGENEILFEINRALTIWEQTQKKDTLAKLLPKLNKLPTPPAIYFQLRDILDSKNYSIHSLANIIARDQAISLKLLKVVNSGFYGLPRSVVTLKRAISLLGTEFVMGIILTAHLFDSLPLPGLNLDKFWQHNFIVSELAKFWAQKQGADNYVINASGLAGLLHDIGNLVILANFPMQYNNVLRKAAGDEAELLRLEYEEFGAGHPEVGGLALKFCNLPDDIIEAVELHHQLLAEGDRSLISKAVFIAERLVNSYSRQAGELVNSDDLMIMEDIDPTEIEDAWKKCGMIIDSV